jgi:ribosomal protein S18 acetylase RimI-like enzyme
MSGSVTPSETNIVQILEASYIPECAHVMAQAFVHSPVYVYMFQDCKDETERKEALAWLFRKNLAAVLEYSPNALRGILSDADHIRNEENNGNTAKVICCFMWVPSPLPPMTLWTLTRAGFWQFPFKFGWKTTQRLFKVLDAVGKDHEQQEKTVAESKNDNGIKVVSNSKQFVSLERMAVHPECQGQGYGSKALKQLLNNGIDGYNSRQIRLSTQEERNVRFYKRLGFEVIDERLFAADSDTKYAFTHWLMVRH